MRRIVAYGFVFEETTQALLINQGVSSAVQGLPYCCFLQFLLTLRRLFAKKI